MTMRVALDDLQEPYRSQAIKKLAVEDNSIADSSSNVEQDISNAPVAKEEVERLPTPCRVHVHSIRKRLTDADGVSAKAVIDGLVHGKLFQDDSPQNIKEVSYSQEKAEKGQEEETIISIYRADEDVQELLGGLLCT